MSKANTLKILIIDDTVFYRKQLKIVCEKIPFLEVAGTASNGKIALSKIKELKPDIISLDVEMPVMDGLETLSEINKQNLDTEAIMVSSLTKEGAQTTVKSLQLGAFDFITKPDLENPEKNTDALKNQLESKIKAFINKKEISDILKSTNKETKEKHQAPTTEKSEPEAPAVTHAKAGIEIIGIGISTGGPNALSKMIPMFSSNFRTPVLIVQHMPAVFTTALSEALNRKSEIKVKEAHDNEVIQPATVYIAPGGKQMKIGIESETHQRILKITDDPPENFCKPSVDYLFRSIANTYGERAIGVIMTGMGADGVLGLRLMKRKGAIIFAQDKLTSTVYGMPGEAVKAGVVDKSLSLHQMADELAKEINKTESGIK